MQYKISVEEVGEVNRSINIEIPREEYRKQFEQKLRQTASDVRLKGFRPGRAPRAIVAKMFGERIHSDVLGKIVSDAFRSAVSEHSLNVVGEPEIKVDDENDDQDLKVTAEIAIYPDPQIEQYEGLAFDVEVAEYSEKEFERRLESLREHAAKVTPIEDRTDARSGDLAMIDYSGTIDGEPFEGASGEGVYVEVGSGKALKEIEEAVVGMAVGDTKEVSAVLPDDAPEEVAGKSAVYTVTLKGIYSKDMPGLDDELAKRTGLAEDFQGLKDYLRNQLEREIEQRNEAERENKLFDALMEKNPFAVPQQLVDEQIRSMLMEMNFLDPRKVESYRVDVSRFRDALNHEAERRVRRAIILSKIVAKEGAEASEDDVSQWLDDAAAKEGRPREEIDNAYGFPKNMERLQQMVVRERTVQRLLAQSQITGKAAAGND